MGNFEKLSVLVIVVIIVMILVVALYTWTDNPDSAPATKVASTEVQKPEFKNNVVIVPNGGKEQPPLAGTGAAMTTEKGTATGATGGTTASPFGPTPSVVIPTTPPPETKPAEPVIHEIVAGDTLGKIAKTYHTTVPAIEQVNPGLDPQNLRIGFKLRIPEKALVAKATTEPKDGSTTDTATVKPVAVATDVPAVKPGGLYTVRKGDTLPGISRRAYGTADRWHEIWLANYVAIEDPDHVSPGTRLKLPTK